MPKRNCEGGYTNCTNTNVRKVTDPYDLEINGRTTKVWLCEQCEQERREDI